MFVFFKGTLWHCEGWCRQKHVHMDIRRSFVSTNRDYFCFPAGYLCVQSCAFAWWSWVVQEYDKIPDHEGARKKKITSIDSIRYRMLLSVTRSPKAQVSNITSRVEMITGIHPKLCKISAALPSAPQFPHPSLQACVQSRAHTGAAVGEARIRWGEV